MSELYLWGWHVFESVVKNKSRKIKAIYILKQHVDKMKNTGLKYTIIDSDSMRKKFGDQTQGIVFLAEQIRTYALRDWLSMHANDDKKKFIVACDNLQDPRNLGAIIRSALAFNVSALLITDNKCASLNATLAKASAGALEMLPIIEVTNLASSLDVLKQNNYFVYALDQNGQKTWKIANKAVLVLGQEGKGLRELTKKKCDDIIKINTQEDFNVLNVSVAAGIAFYKILGE